MPTQQTPLPADLVLDVSYRVRTKDVGSKAATVELLVLRQCAEALFGFSVGSSVWITVSVFHRIGIVTAQGPLSLDSHRVKCHAEGSRYLKLHFPQRGSGFPAASARRILVADTIMPTEGHPLLCFLVPSSFHFNHEWSRSKKNTHTHT